MKRVAGGLLALFAGVCAAQNADPRAASKAALDAAPACCDRFSEFNYPRLPVNFQEQFMVGRGGPAFEFPTGKSFFLAFELPKYESRYGVNLTTRLTERGLDVSIFCPVVYFLDADHRPVARLSNFPYIAVNPIARRGLPGLSASIPVTDAVRTARYIVFMTEPAVISRSISFHKAAGSITTVGAFDVPCNYEGQLGLSINAKYSPDSTPQSDAK